MSVSRAILLCHAAGPGTELLEQAIEDASRDGVLSAKQAELLREEGVGLAGAAG